MGLIKIAAKYICIDIGGTKLLGALFDGDKIILKYKKKTKAYMGAQVIVEKIVTMVNEIIDSNDINIQEISAISSGFAGVVDEEFGRLITVQCHEALEQELEVNRSFLPKEGEVLCLDAPKKSQPNIEIIWIE